MENGLNKGKTGAYLGIDYGESKVGLAIADEETKMAFAFGILVNDKSLYVKLKEIISQEDIETVVIGLPSNVNREETEYTSDRVKDTTVSHAARKFAKKLAEIADVKIAFHDEMFTTKMAKANLIERGDRNVGKHDDAEAARIILQEWLDRTGISL